MPKRTDDFEGLICDCGKHCKCIDNPDYPESVSVWYCNNCKKYLCGY